MAKKRKTLPKNFDELLDQGNLEELKSILSKCELNACGGYNKQTAIAFENCPDELTRWLVDQGADLQAPDGWRRTPLHSRAGCRRHCNIQILLDLGADINNNDPSHGTPLHFAVDSFNREHVKVLLEHGAQVNIPNREGYTPLEFGLLRCNNINLIDMAEISQMMLAAGAEKTPRMKEFVRELGETFEFHRKAFDTDDAVGEYDAALKTLYSLFDAEPVPERRVHDGKSEIIVSEETWQKQHQELWDYLVPSSGPAETIQGEVIRITGRIANELEGNGGANWDGEYRKMSDMFLEFMKWGNPLTSDDIEETGSLIEDMKLKKGDTSRLAQFAVKWVISNPKPINLPEISYKR